MFKKIVVAKLSKLRIARWKSIKSDRPNLTERKVGDDIYIWRNTAPWCQFGAWYKKGNNQRLWELNFMTPINVNSTWGDIFRYLKAK